MNWESSRRKGEIEEPNKLYTPKMRIYRLINFIISRFHCATADLRGNFFFFHSPIKFMQSHACKLPTLIEWRKPTNKQFTSNFHYFTPHPYGIIANSIIHASCWVTLFLIIFNVVFTSFIIIEHKRNKERMPNCVVSVKAP